MRWMLWLVVVVAAGCPPNGGTGSDGGDSCRLTGAWDPKAGAYSDPLAPDGTPCTEDGNPCTADVCRMGVCTHAAGNAGAVCRAAAGGCDVAETCDGTRDTCPADAKLTGGTVCRDAAGACDVAESCDGSSDDCPADAKSAAGTVCRDAAGACDVAESCDGVANDCPADAKSTAVCRASAGACDLPESCDGLANNCPTDAKSTAVCRASAGACDLAESCNGASNDCPADAKVVNGTLCRASGGPCDVAELCDGVSAACPADGKVHSGVLCRTSAGPCDLADTCDGVTTGCTDAKVANGTLCRASVGPCDLADICDGATNACTDAKVAAGTQCRASAGVCDVADTCDGTSNGCTDNKATSCPLTYSCLCVASGGCGNGGASGTSGQIDTGQSPSDVVSLYAPGRAGSHATGWACRPEGTNVCTCVGSPATSTFCGNGSFGGAGYGVAGGPTVATGVSTADVFASYGPDRVGALATGWSCVPTRIDSGNDMTYSCECVDATCGNGAPSGVQGDRATGVTGADVDGSYGVRRFGAQRTGWSCTATGVNIVACEGTPSIFFCGNNAFGGSGSPESIVSDVSTATALASYGVLRIDTLDTGWNAYCSSY